MIAGIDEVGRGCLAGPVVAAAVILPEKYYLPGLTDSKLLKAKNRMELSCLIKKEAVCFGYGIVWPAIIDKINILQASLLAMAKACSHLPYLPQYLYIDGNKKIPDKFFDKTVWKQMPRQKVIIKGDLLIPAISAASILAKTFRDKIMINLHKKWPEYNFAKHKGYATSEHIKALRQFGPSSMHRLTFKKVIFHQDNTRQIDLFNEISK